MWSAQTDPFAIWWEQSGWVMCDSYRDVSRFSNLGVLWTPLAKCIISKEWLILTNYKLKLFSSARYFCRNEITYSILFAIDQRNDLRNSESLEQSSRRAYRVENGVKIWGKTDHTWHTLNLDCKYHDLWDFLSGEQIFGSWKLSLYKNQ